MPAGRPTDYKPEYCDKVRELGAEGMSPCEMAMEIGHVRSTLLNWCKLFPEFSTAFNDAKELSQAWWEAQGRKNLENRDFNAGLWKQNIGPRFKDDWTDTQNVRHAGADGGPIKTEHTVSPEAEALLAAIAPKS